MPKRLQNIVAIIEKKANKIKKTAVDQKQYLTYYFNDMYMETEVFISYFNEEKKFLTRVEEAIRAPHKSIWSSNYVKSNRPKCLPTIFRQTVVGKSVETKSNTTAFKRNSDGPTEFGDIDGKEAEEDIMGMYSTKRPRISDKVSTISSLAERSVLQRSRYFTNGHSEKASNNKSSPTPNTTLDSFLSSSTSPNNDTKSSQNQEEDMPVISNGDISNICDVLKNEEISIDEKEKDNDSAIDSLPSSCASGCSVGVSDCEQLSSSDSPTGALRTGLAAFKFKPLYSRENSMKIFSFQNCENDTKDTVGMNESVFFNRKANENLPSSKKVIKTATPKIRAGLSRKKPSSQQTLITKFGFQPKPKL